MANCKIRRQDSPSKTRRLALRRGIAAAVAAVLAPSFQAARAAHPVLLGFDGELSVESSSSAQAIQAGIEIALREINAAGGVLQGRPLSLVSRDNRTMPARAGRNLREFAEMPDLVGVFCGRYSPTVLETVPLFHELRLPLLDPWASADGIIEHGITPSYTFRLGMADSWAMPVMAAHAARRGHQALGLIAVNTSWGRSSERALQLHLQARGGVGADGQRLVATRWYNYTDGPEVFATQFVELVQRGVEAVIFVGNFREGGELVQAIAARPRRERRPVLAHSGVMGGDFFAACGSALPQVDVSIIQTFGFDDTRRPRAAAVRTAAMQHLGLAGKRVPSAAGLAQAYDLTHITARALNAAGSTDRSALRDALERSRPYAGLIRDYAAPFTPTRHEALSPGDLYMARFNEEGALVRTR